MKAVQQCQAVQQCLDVYMQRADATGSQSMTLQISVCVCVCVHAQGVDAEGQYVRDLNAELCSTRQLCHSNQLCMASSACNTAHTLPTRQAYVCTQGIDAEGAQGAHDNN